MAEAKETNAKKVYTLDEIKYNEANKAMAIVAWIPLVGFILLLVEKKDEFVRYNGAQATLLGVLQFMAWIPIIGWLIAPICLVLIIVGMVKSAKGERFDIPLISDLALKVMGLF
ncbi:MAG: DUF4870 domain-containing protein [Candidatus Dojkabacteria bacterium]|jgi:uncharacterized membrane protein